MDVKLEQQRRLRETIEWARKIKEHLAEISEANGYRVHFRPGSTGVSMVGLDHERPQRGRSGIQDLARFARDFESEFTTHCRGVEQGRPTGEKALQSFLIRNAHGHGRDLHAINVASSLTNEAVRLVFVTDEISLPVARGPARTYGKTVCDVLALRRDGGRSTPVLLELKDNRALTRLVEQVNGYAALIDEHAELYAELFGALLGEDVQFDAPTERWMVWPQAGEPADPREAELTNMGIRVVGYTNDDTEYAFRVGQGVGRPATPPNPAVRRAHNEEIVSSQRAAHGDTSSNPFAGDRSGLVSAAPIIDVEQRFAGCLLGGAVGDALGGAIEFMSLAAIRSMFGPDGIADLAPAYGRVGAVTETRR